MKKEDQKIIKIAMITGYLGAGKTTLLNHILTNTEGIRAAVIVNDIGEVNIDAELIAQTGAVTQMEDSLIPMTNGCICCSLSEDLANQLTDIAYSENFDYIIIEASGVCEPMPIAYTIANFCEAINAPLNQEYDENGDPIEMSEEEAQWPPVHVELDNIIAVVDCARMYDEFNGGNDLIAQDSEEDIANLLVNQIEFCSTLILNKADQVTQDEIAQLHAIVRSLQKDAEIIVATQGNVSLDKLLNTNKYDFDNIFDSAGWVKAMDEDPDGHDDEGHGAYHESESHDDEHEHGHHHDEHDEHDHHHDQHEHDSNGGHGHHDRDEHEHHYDENGNCSCGHHHEEGHDHLSEYGITTFVYERRKPFTNEALLTLIHNWPKEVIRCKGMVWQKENSDTCYLFEQAGKKFYLSENGVWLACANEEEREVILKYNPNAMKDWDDEVGDRRVKLVFIGKNMNREEIEAQLDSLIG